MTNTQMTLPLPRDFVAEAMAEVVPNIGQIDRQAQKLLDRAVKAGKLAKWRGHWFPVAGAPFGLGPPKTCYGTPEMAAHFAEWRESMPHV